MAAFDIDTVESGFLRQLCRMQECILQLIEVIVCYDRVVLWESVSFVKVRGMVRDNWFWGFAIGSAVSSRVRQLKYAAWFETRLLLAKFLSLFDEFCECFPGLVVKPEL